jgi:serine/threonine protein phosphatase PrpC
MGDSVCATCQTPLVHRYLWATSSSSAKIPPGTKVAHRYEVISSQIWLDTQPGLSPDVPEELPTEVIPYLQLYQERLRLPQAYGFVSNLEGDTTDILLLENVPIDEIGNIYPTIVEAWEQATAVRQVYWLWQILQLWKPLSELGLSRSLLVPDNLRVQGWCVRLLELYQTPTDKKLSLQNLGECWQFWVSSAKPSVAKGLQNLVQQMCESEVELDDIATQLNNLLLASAAELPLVLKVAGSTDIRPIMAQNEDACYPNALSDLDEPLSHHLSIVCDGIGGHEGGGVASKLAVQSVKLQMRVLLREVTEQAVLVPPELLQEQLEASLRVVNNLISARNNEQKRQGRGRMATTIVMALQVPQRVQTSTGWQSNNTHELYLANVGDSRVEQSWQDYAIPVLAGKLTVEDAVRKWIDLANKKNGRDNTSVVLTYCRVSPEYLVPVTPALPEEIIEAEIQKEQEELKELEELEELEEPISFTESSQALLDLDLNLDLSDEPVLSFEIPPSLKRKPKRDKRLPMLGGVLALLVGGTSLGLLAWWQFNPQGFQQMCRQFPQRIQQLCPPGK